MPKFSTFTDTFDTQVDPAKWTVAGTVPWDSATKQAVIPMRSANVPGIVIPGLTSAGGYIYDLTASSVFFKFTLPSVVTTNYVIEFYVSSSTSAIYLKNTIQNGNVVLSKWNGSVTSTLLTTPYNAAIHGPWWRWREAGGTCYYETSQDGLSWTVLVSTPNPPGLTTMCLIIDAYTNANEPIVPLYVDYVNVAPGGDPWVLVTGPKGTPGTPTPVGFSAVQVPGVTPAITPAPPPVRRYCFDFPSTSNQQHGGFIFAYNVKNYVAQTGAFHCRLQGYRTPQGRVTLEGLIYAIQPDTGILFYLPWDMLPYPSTVRVIALQNTGNQQGRSDIYFKSGYGWVYEVNSTAVVYQNQFTGVHVSYQTHVPSCWVDFGLKADAIQGPGSTIIYTISPGQVSGYLRGAPFTVTIPSVVQTAPLPYTPSPNVNSLQAFLYYDVTTGSFGHVVNVATTFYYDPSIWMEMADRGQIVLMMSNFVYSTSLYDPTNTMDHRFLMRGPLDPAMGGPSA